jgi:peroxiredoxin
LKDNYTDVLGFSDEMLARELKSLEVIPGNPAPSFKEVSIDGDTLSLDDFKGRFVFIDFWGTWCGPCIDEIPFVKKLAEHFDKNDLQVIGLAKDEIENLEEFVIKKKLPYPNAVADKAIEDYCVTAFPTTFLIDPEGIIIASGLRGENLIELVEKKIEEYNE